MSAGLGSVENYRMRQTQGVGTNCFGRCRSGARCQEAEHAIVGKSINETTAAAAGKAAVASAKPLSRNAYKIQLTQVAVKRALLQAAKGGQA